MRKEAAFDYVCEVCGKRFPSTQGFEAQAHEQECLERKRRRENCTYCGGTGEVTETRWVSSLEEEKCCGVVIDYHEVSKPQKVKVPCPRCSK